MGRYLIENAQQRSLRTTKDALRYLETHLIDKNINQINRDLIDKIKLHKLSTGVTIGTVNRNLTVLRAVLNAAKYWEWLDAVPIIKLIPEPEKPIRYLTSIEVERLLNELPSHLKAMAIFSLAAGLRHGNTVGLKWEQVNLQGETPYLQIHGNETKNKKLLTIPINKTAVNIIRSQIGKHLTYVFTYKGEPVKTANTKAYRNALKRAEIKDANWHTLRHTWATEHAMNGTPAFELMKLGGWSSIEMVLVYVHFAVNHLANYVENSNSKVDTTLAQIQKKA